MRNPIIATKGVVIMTIPSGCFQFWIDPLRVHDTHTLRHLYHTGT